MDRTRNFKAAEKKKWGIYQGSTQQSPSVIANKSFMERGFAVFAGIFPLLHISREEKK